MARLCALLSKEFSAPQNAVEGLAAYDLEQGVKQPYAKPKGAVLRPKASKKLTNLVPLLAKGAPPGHEFYGNQYVAIPGRPTKEWNLKVQQAWKSPPILPTPNLARKHAEAIREYSAEGHEKINAALRSGKSNPAIKDLDDALATTPSLPSPVMAYRGAQIDKEVLQSLIGTGEYRDPAYRSFTTSLDKAKGFSEQKFVGATSFKPGSERVIFELLADTGSKAMDISSISKTPKEKELLIGRDQKIEVVAARRTGPNTHRVQLLLRGKVKKADLSILAKKAKPDYQAFAEWLFAAIEAESKKSKAKKADLSQLIKGAPPGHEFYGNQWTGSLGAKPTEAQNKGIKGIKELLASGHPWSVKEISEITGMTPPNVNKAVNQLVGKEHAGLMLVKTEGKPNMYQVKEVGGGLKETEETKAPTVAEEKAEAATETYKAIPPATPMSKAQADKVYQHELSASLHSLQASLEKGADPKAAVLQWKNEKALAMAQWKANTTGVGIQAKHQEVFGADLKLAESIAGVTSVAEQQAAFYQWKLDTAAEKAGKFGTKATPPVKEPEPVKAAEPMKAEPSSLAQGHHASLVPPGFKQISADDFTAAGGGKWNAGMTKLANALSKGSGTSVANKQAVEKALGARLKDAPNFKAMSELYDKRGGAKTSATGTMQAALISKWAGTSADSDELAQAMQMTIRDVFGMDHSDVNSIGNSSLPGSKEETDKLLRNAGAQLLGQGYKHEVHGEVFQASLKEFVRAQYDNTQTFLKDAGIKEVYLARGMKVGSSSHKAEIIGLKLQPASSFTTNMKTAKSFSHGHTVYLVKVPAAQVLGSFRTGYGCTGEDEVVVLADKKLQAVKLGTSRAGARSSTAFNVAHDLNVSIKLP